MGAGVGRHHPDRSPRTGGLKPERVSEQGQSYLGTALRATVASRSFRNRYGPAHEARLEDLDGGRRPSGQDHYARKSQTAPVTLTAVAGN